MVRPLRRPAQLATFGLLLAASLVGAVATYLTPSEEAVTVAEGGVGVGLEVGEEGKAYDAGLRDGDVLLSVEGKAVPDSVRHEGHWHSFSGSQGETRRALVRRGGEEREVVFVLGEREIENARALGLSAEAVGRVVRAIGYAALLAFIVVALGLFVRVRGEGYLASLAKAMLAFVAGIGVSIGWEVVHGALPAGSWGSTFLTMILVALVVSAFPTLVSALARFPDGRCEPAWTRRAGRIAVGIAVVAIGLAIAIEQTTEWESADLVVVMVGLLGIMALPAVGLSQRYVRTEDAIVRQQMKWVLLPLGAFVAVMAADAVVEVGLPHFGSEGSVGGYVYDLTSSTLTALAAVAIPLGVLAGVLRFRPWDADLWIARSAAVGAATLVLTGVFAGGVEAMRVGLQASFGAGAEPVAGALAAVVSLAAFNPVREWFLRRADADLHRTREALCDRLPLVLTGRQVVAPPAEVGRVAMRVVRDALRTERAAVLTSTEGGAWSAVAAEGVEGGAACAWAARTLPHPDALPAHSEQVWEDDLFVLRVPLRSVEGEPVGVLALGTHGRGRGYSTEERRALDGASFALAEALLVSERRETSRARDYDRLAGLVARFADAAGDGQAGEPAQPEATPPRP